MAILNASFHYSEDYSTALAEVMRVLVPAETIAIVDSPIYHHASSGKQMVGERRQQFISQFGFPSDSLASENFLTYKRLRDLGSEFSLHWTLSEPALGLAWKIKRQVNGLRSRRESAKLPVIVGKPR